MSQTATPVAGGPAPPSFLPVVLDIDLTVLHASSLSDLLKKQRDPQLNKRLLEEDHAMLLEFSKKDCVKVRQNGALVRLNATPEACVLAGKEASRPVIRLADGRIFTRIDPKVGDTSILVYLRPQLDDGLLDYLRRHRGQLRVYVSTAGEREYAAEMWRLLDPRGELIPHEHIAARFLSVWERAQAGQRGPPGIQNGIKRLDDFGIDGAPAVVILDDKWDAWRDQDQHHVHAVKEFNPYSYDTQDVEQNFGVQQMTEYLELKHKEWLASTGLQRQDSAGKLPCQNILVKQALDASLLPAIRAACNHGNGTLEPSPKMREDGSIQSDGGADRAAGGTSRGGCSSDEPPQRPQPPTRKRLPVDRVESKGPSATGTAGPQKPASFLEGLTSNLLRMKKGELPPMRGAPPAPRPAGASTPVRPPSGKERDRPTESPGPMRGSGNSGGDRGGVGAPASPAAALRDRLTGDAVNSTAPAADVGGGAVVTPLKDRVGGAEKASTAWPGRGDEGSSGSPLGAVASGSTAKTGDASNTSPTHVTASGCTFASIAPALVANSGSASVATSAPVLLASTVPARAASSAPATNASSVPPPVARSAPAPLAARGPAPPSGSTPVASSAPPTVVSSGPVTIASISPAPVASTTPAGVATSEPTINATNTPVTVVSNGPALYSGSTPVAGSRPTPVTPVGGGGDACNNLVGFNVDSPAKHAAAVSQVADVPKPAAAIPGVESRPADAGTPLAGAAQGTSHGGGEGGRTAQDSYHEFEMVDDDSDDTVAKVSPDGGAGTMVTNDNRGEGAGERRVEGHANAGTSMEAGAVQGTTLDLCDSPKLIHQGKGGEGGVDGHGAGSKRKGRGDVLVREDASGDAKRPKAKPTGRTVEDAIIVLSDDEDEDVRMEAGERLGGGDGELYRAGPDAAPFHPNMGDGIPPQPGGVAGPWAQRQRPAGAGSERLDKATTGAASRVPLRPSAPETGCGKGGGSPPVPGERARQAVGNVGKLRMADARSAAPDGSAGALAAGVTVVGLSNERDGPTISHREVMSVGDGALIIEKLLLGPPTQRAAKSRLPAGEEPQSKVVCASSGKGSWDEPLCPSREGVATCVSSIADGTERAGEASLGVTKPSRPGPGEQEAHLGTGNDVRTHTKPQAADNARTTLLAEGVAAGSEGRQPAGRTTGTEQREGENKSVAAAVKRADEAALQGNSGGALQPSCLPAELRATLGTRISDSDQRPPDGTLPSGRASDSGQASSKQPAASLRHGEGAGSGDEPAWGGQGRGGDAAGGTCVTRSRHGGTEGASVASRPSVLEAAPLVLGGNGISSEGAVVLANHSGDVGGPNGGLLQMPGSCPGELVAGSRGLRCVGVPRASASEAAYAARIEYGRDDGVDKILPYVLKLGKGILRQQRDAEVAFYPVVATEGADAAFAVGDFVELASPGSDQLQIAQVIALWQRMPAAASSSNILSSGADAAATHGLSSTGFSHTDASSSAGGASAQVTCQESGDGGSDKHSGALPGGGRMICRLFVRAGQRDAMGAQVPGCPGDPRPPPCPTLGGHVDIFCTHTVWEDVPVGDLLIWPCARALDAALWR